MAFAAFGCRNFFQVAAYDADDLIGALHYDIASPPLDASALAAVYNDCVLVRDAGLMETCGTCVALDACIHH